MQCSYFEQQICRSCQLLDQPYESTLRRKQAWITGLFPETDVRPVVPTVRVQGSRIRARLAVFGTLSQPQFGFLDQDRRIAAVDQCPLHHPQINRLITALPILVQDCGLTPYSMTDNRGEMKFVVITCSPTHDRLMLQLVLRSREAVDRVRRFWNVSGNEVLADVQVLSVNVQPVRSSLLNGTDEIGVSEIRRLPVRYDSTTVLYGPQCFIQTNYEVALQLYRRAGRILLEEEISSLLDLYCGSGAFSLQAAASQIRVHGIDIVPDAVTSAQESAALNGFGISHYECLSDGVGGAKTMLSMSAGGVDAPDAIICNPPRRGLDSATCRLLQDLKPRLLLYSSCNPETQCRDLRELSGSFRIRQIIPFDMFPFTKHLEVLAVLART